MENAKRIIFVTRNTLDDVDVRGVDNMRKILGCYDALGAVLKIMEADLVKKENNQKEERDDG